VAAENKLLNAAAYKAWIESHTPTAIEEAKLARKRLKAKFNYTAKGKPLHDDRRPRRQTPAYAFFCRARWGSGEFQGVPVGQAGKTMGEEWKALSEADKQVSNRAAKLCQRPRLTILS
jgi:hypothetical protein